MKKATPSILFASDTDRNLRVSDSFYKNVTSLRGAFETRFANPMKATSDRFCWDYWNVPDQYRLLRTPAESFFGPKLFNPFLEHLLSWGRQNLGCQMISHPWMSVYLDGSFQALHSDVPHGPWSFVYSLTPWGKHSFTGGRTLLAKPKLLRYFSELSHQRSDEQKDFFDRIEPKLNRLSVFDPRYPHGVEEVRGAHELHDARVVIHGWFTEPRPMLNGALTFSKIERPLDALATSLLKTIEPSDHTGLLSLRYEIEASGKIKSVTVLSSHLINSQGGVYARARLKKNILETLLEFPKARSGTQLTLPLEFQR